MFAFIIQTLLLLAIAYIIGCVFGCLAHRWLVGDEAESNSAQRDILASSIPIVVAEPAAKTTPAVVKAAPVAAVAASTAKPAAVKAKPAPKAAPKPKAKPAAKTRAPAAKVAAPTTKDDLKRIRGIGRQNEAKLNAVGIMQFAQIASWSKQVQAEMGDRLAFPGRIEREEWVAQAKVLAKGDETEFSKRVAKGEVETSIGKGSKK